MEGGGKAAKEDLILYLNEVKGPLCAWCYDEPVPFKEINKKIRGVFVLMVSIRLQFIFIIVF